MISTHNGVKRLSSTLHAIAKLDTQKISNVELIVVDNNSNDGTFSLVAELWKSLASPFPLVLLYQPNPGKLAAQELGLSRVHYPYCVICDDDNELSVDYLNIGFNIFENNPKVGIIGGQGIPISSQPFPEWLSKYAYHFAAAPQAETTGPVYNVRNVVYGAGMWIRMQGYITAKNGGFTFRLASRTGRSLATGGEDSELCWAFRFIGYDIWYAENLKFYHHIPASKLSKSYLKKLLRGFHANGPLGKSYLRIWRKEISEPVKFFWFKELVYSLLYLMKLPFNNSIEKKNNDLWRVLNDLRYLITHREKYDSQINKILLFYNRFN